MLTTELVNRAASVFDTYGADAWYERPLEEFVPEGFTCPSCKGTTFEREQNILDVWFDSGSSHEGVLPVHAGLSWPADMYLEGSDQYRGWFHSSLLVGLGTRHRAPFREVLTHGFVVNEEGKKMSKSLGNDIPPQQIIDQGGAEVLRLWVAMTDYRDEVRLSKEILARTTEAYRKLRNTLRYCAANLYDFDPGTDLVPVDRLMEIDRYALARFAEAAKKIVAAYAAYDFPAIFQVVNMLVTVDLSAFYFDVSKDRLYTWGAASAGRRSAQTALFHIVDGLVRLIAPILPVSADELWRALPGERDDTVHLATFPTGLDTFADPALAARWDRLLTVREAVLPHIEAMRQQKVVGQSLEAHVTLTASDELYRLLDAHRGDLPMLFITSTASLVEGAPGGELGIAVARTDGTKCARCWRYVPSIATDDALAGLCERCIEAVTPAKGVGAP